MTEYTKGEQEAREQETRKHEREDQQKRESGQPGGGQGRADEVGGSGVHPASGPYPSGSAETHGQASWGQGERGAEGYEDHGGSEPTMTEDGQLLGGTTAGPGGEPTGEETDRER